MSTGNFKPSHASLWLIGLAWTLPFLQPWHRYPIPSFYSEWLALTLGLLALLPLSKRDAWHQLRLPLVSLAALLLAALPWLQFALGMMSHPGQALAPSVYLVWAALLVLAGSVVRRELGARPVAETLARFLLVGGVLSALAGIAQHYHLSPLVGSVVAVKRTEQVFGNLSQANHFAAYSVFALASLVYLASRARVGRAAAAATATVLLYGAALSGSRSVWLYLVAIAVAALALHARARSRESRTVLIASAMLLPAFAVTNLLALLPPLSVPDARVETSLDRLFAVVSGTSVRAELWKEAWRMFVGAPFLGVGFGQFAWHHFELQASAGAPAGIGLTNHAHNIVLQLLAEAGLAGTLLVAGGLAIWLLGLRDATIGPESWWLIAIAAVLGVHSLLEFPLWYTFFLGMGAAVAGVGPLRTVAVDLRRIGPLLVMLVAAGGVVNAALVMLDFRRVERLVFTPYRHASEVPVKEKFSDVLGEAYRDPLLAPYVEVIVAMGAAVDRDDLENKLALVERAMRFAPVPEIVFRRSYFLALAGESEAAALQLRQSLRAYPAEAGRVRLELQALSRRYPGEFAALLKLATASRNVFPLNAP